MEAVLPPEISVQAWGENVRYRLPSQRPLGMRVAGVGMAAFGALFGGFAGFWIGLVLHLLQAADHPLTTAGKLFPLFGVPFLLAGLGMVARGLFLAAGHSEVEIARGRLRAVEAIGPLRWPRSRPLARVQQLSIGTWRRTHSHSTDATGLGEGWQAIRASGEGLRPLWLAAGYPREWLIALAIDLQNRMSAAGVRVGPSVASPPVAVVEEGDERHTLGEPTDQPCDSGVIKEANGEVLRLTLPPRGVWRAAKSLLIFGIFWCSFMLLFSVGSGFGRKFEAGSSVWLIVAFLALFWAIGLALILVAVNMGRRRAMLLASPRELRIAQTGLFGAKRFLWRADAIKMVQVGPSGMEVNGVPVLDLRIQPVEGKAKGFFAGRDEAELRWIAAEVRRALQLPPSG